MSTKTKKLINAPENLIPDFIEGLLGAYPEMLGVEGKTGRAVVARHGPRDGKVGVVVGGGSGHEPAFAGYVGQGLADAAAVGNVFASRRRSRYWMPAAPPMGARASCSSMAIIPAMS